MRNPFFILTSLFFTISSLSQSENLIDNINSEEEVNQFIRTKFKDYSEFSVVEYDSVYKDALDKHIADSLNIKLWYKADFDNNGLTDLMAYGNNKWDRLVVVMAFENGKFEINDVYLRWIGYLGTPFFSVDLFQDEVAIIRYQKIDQFSLSLLSLYNEIIISEDSLKNLQNSEGYLIYIDTLVYKFDDFIEYNVDPCKKEIKRIELSIDCPWPGFQCDMSDLVLSSNGRGHFFSYGYKYIFKLEDSYLATILGLIKYMNPFKLKNSYITDFASDGGSDDITIIFNDGTEYNIYIYGSSGTLSLRRLLKLLYDIPYLSN